MREEKVIMELKGRDTCLSIQYYSVASPLRSSDNTNMESTSKGLTVKHQKTAVRCIEDGKYPQLQKKEPTT